MPPRTEKRPGVSRITAAERREVVEAIAGHTYPLIEENRNKQNWNQSKRYIGLIGMVGALHLPHIKPNQVAHTKRMIGLEAASITERRRRPKGVARFWEEVKDAAGEEIERAEDFEELGGMPRPYQYARRDLEELRSLIANPLILALRESVRAVRNKR